MSELSIPDSDQLKLGSVIQLGKTFALADLNDPFEKLNKLHTKTLNKAVEFANAVLTTGKAVSEMNAFLKKHRKVIVGDKPVKDFIDDNASSIGFGYAQFSKYQKIWKNKEQVQNIIGKNDEYTLVLLEDGKEVQVPASVDNMVSCINSRLDKKPSAKVDFISSINSIISDLEGDTKTKAETFKEQFVSAESEIESLQDKLNELRQARKTAKEGLTAIKASLKKK
jgi:hypothetical protein